MAAHKPHRRRPPECRRRNRPGRLQGPRAAPTQPSPGPLDYTLCSAWRALGPFHGATPYPGSSTASVAAPWTRFGCSRISQGARCDGAEVDQRCRHRMRHADADGVNGIARAPRLSRATLRRGLKTHPVSTLSQSIVTAMRRTSRAGGLFVSGGEPRHSFGLDHGHGRRGHARVRLPSPAPFARISFTPRPPVRSPGSAPRVGPCAPPRWTARRPIANRSAGRRWRRRRASGSTPGPRTPSRFRGSRRPRRRNGNDVLHAVSSSVMADGGPHSRRSHRVVPPATGAMASIPLHAGEKPYRHGEIP